jgi:hypothetical protein
MQAPGPVVHDLGVASVQVQVLAGFPFNVSALPPAGITVDSVSWQFGDGTNVTGQTSLTATHEYASPGLDYVYASATDTDGTVHDNLDQLLPVEVLSSHAGDSYGLVPDLLGEIVANSSGLPNPTPFLAPGGSVTVAVVATTPPRNVQSVIVGAGFAGPVPSSASASLSGETLAPNGTSQVTLSFTGSQPPGLTTLTYWEETSLFYNGSTIVDWTNFTYSVPVGMGGAVAPRSSSPDPSVLTVDATSLPETFDPSVDYDTAGLNAFQNVYQTLIAVNGTQAGSAPADFVPEIATCVPGSSLCTSLYGTNLTDGRNFTFVISSTPKFYDPSTTNSWGVYPSDVVFSIARTLAFSTLPCVGCNNGWILAQALLSPGNDSWDFIHGPYNNTPADIFASMTVNGTDCPSSALTGEHGCVTFDADGSGHTWPFFLALIADPWGGSITPCGWFSAAAQGAGLPYWSVGNVSSTGDEPCQMPGVGGFGVSPATIPYIGWDSYELGVSGYPIAGTVPDAMVGSGPYYASSIVPQVSYTLQANPQYGANPYCTFSGCQPAAGTYIPSVSVYQATISLATGALANGTADFADLAQNGTSPLPSLLGAGVAGMASAPILQTDFQPLDLDYNATVATGLTGLTYTAPPSFLADSNLRQFLIASFSYATMQSALFTNQGIQYRFPTGGAIPTFLGSTTPTNVSWPWGNPDSDPSDVGSAGYWWTQTESDSYAGLACTTVAPCTFPVAYASGDATEFAVLAAWNATVRAISGGAIAPLISPVSFVNIVFDTLYATPGQDPFALYPLAWSDDYGDASDFVGPMYLSNQDYAYADQLSEVLSEGSYDSYSCPTSLTYYSSLASPLPVECQGPAYSAMTVALSQAAVVPNGAARDLLYDEAEQVAQRLGLYASDGQLNVVNTFAGWIDPQSVVVNPALGTIPWYDVRDYAGPASPLTVRGPIASLNPSPVEVPFQLSGIAVGGTLGYTYTWSGLPPGCLSEPTATLNCTPTTSGSFTVTLQAHDQSGASATADLALVIGAPSPLTFSSFTAAPSSITLGSSTVLTVTTIGGFPPLSYAYSALPSGCGAQDLATFSCTPTAMGSFTLHVIVMDSQGASVQGNASLEVTAGPVFAAALGVAPASAIVDVGVTVTLTIRGSNGTLPISGTFVAPGDCARTFTWTTSRSTTIACTAPEKAGTYPLNATLIDALGRTAYVNGSLVVNAAPSIQSFGPATTYDVNESAQLGLTFVGGTGPYTIAYTSLPVGCTGGNVTSVNCTFTQAGTYSVGITVTDSFGVFTTGETKIVVDAALEPVSLTANPSSVQLTTELNFTATVHGGALPYTYVYSSLPTGCATANTSTLACLPTAAGNFTTEVLVHDEAGVSEHATVSVSVVNLPVVTTPPNGIFSNSMTVDLLVGLGLVVVVIAIVGVVLSRRRGGGASEDGPTAPVSGGPPS